MPGQLLETSFSAGRSLLDQIGGGFLDVNTVERAVLNVKKRFQPQRIHKLFCGYHRGGENRFGTELAADVGARRQHGSDLLQFQLADVEIAVELQPSLPT